MKGTETRGTFRRLELPCEAYQLFRDRDSKRASPEMRGYEDSCSSGGKAGEVFVECAGIANCISRCSLCVSVP